MLLCISNNRCIDTTADLPFDFNYDEFMEAIVSDGDQKIWWDIGLRCGERVRVFFGDPDSSNDAYQMSGVRTPCVGASF